MLTQGSAKYVVEIQRIVVHEYYNAQMFDYDIALLQLKKPWPPSLSPLVQPVCLPPSSHTVTDSHRCVVTGWGYRTEDGKYKQSLRSFTSVHLLFFVSVYLNLGSKGAGTYPSCHWVRSCKILKIYLAITIPKT